jgi:hypothetical protein
MGTFMHELGHTLGLRHGGGDNVQYKPNYYSVMNYSFQVPGGQNNPTLARGSWRLMYSHYALPPLNEFKLNEKVGLNPPLNRVPKVLVPYARPDGSVVNARMESGVAVDWDGDGDSSDVAHKQVDLTNIDPDPNVPAQPIQVLNGFDDWSNLKLGFRTASKYTPFIPNAPPPTASPLPLTKTDADTVIDEMDLQTHNHLLSLPPYGLYEPWDDWPKDAGTPIVLSNEPFTQRYPVTAPDGQGGAFVVWQDFHSMTEREGMRLKAQYFDSSGQTRWPGIGIPMDTTRRDQEQQQAISDGNGGLIVVWRDHHDHAYNVYAQRINAMGQLLWGKGGVCASTSTDTLYGTEPYLTGDGSGGAIIIWADGHMGGIGLYAQHVAAGGAVDWPSGGVRLTTSLVAGGLDIATDDSSGAYVSWVDTQDPYQVKSYVQHVGPDGTLLWQSSGIRLSTLAASHYASTITADGVGGVIVGWVDYRSGYSEIFAQRMSHAGTPLWAANGIPVTSGTRNSYWPRTLGRMNGSSIIAWFRGTTYWMQKLNPQGQPAWQANGVIAGDTVKFDPYSNPLVPDGAGGAVFPFTTTSRVVSVQRVDSTGVRRWGIGGQVLYSDLFEKWMVSMATDGHGGGLIAWENGYPNPNPYSGYPVYEILSQKVNGNGGFGNGPFTAVVPENAPRPFEYGLDQNYPNPFNPTTTIRFSVPAASNVSLVVYDILGRRVRTLVDQPKGAGVYSVVWDGKNESGSGVASGVYFLMMRAEGQERYQKTVKALLLR